MRFNRGEPQGLRQGDGAGYHRSEPMSADLLRRVPALALAPLVWLALAPAVAAREPAELEGEPIVGRPPPWIERAPGDSAVEFGVYGGVLLLGDHHELFSPDPERVDQGFAPLARVAPDVGLRVGYYPWRWVGIEAEGGVMPTRLRDRDGSALLYTARGQLVGRLALWAVVPFVVVGGGALGIDSKPGVLGRDVDAALHVGGGLELFIIRQVALRLDVRDVISWRRGVEPSFGAHGLEASLGVTVSLQVPR